MNPKILFVVTCVIISVKAKGVPSMLPKPTTNSSLLIAEASNKLSSMNMNVQIFGSKEELFEEYRKIMKILLNVGCETLNKYKSKYDNFLITYYIESE